MIYHKLDRSFNIPKFHAYFLLNSPYSFNSAKDFVFNIVLSNLISQDINKKFSNAKQVGYEIYFKPTLDGLEI